MLIPRIFHQVWVGPNPLPEEFGRYQQTWLDHHPAWELRFWTDQNLPEGLRRPEAYDRLRSPTERCDILRLELLWRFGGVYVDCDFECLRSIEPLLEDIDFFTAYVEPTRVNHAIMGAVAGHRILDLALEEIRPREFHGYDKNATGPLFFDRLLKGYPDVTVFEKELFYAKGEVVGPRAYAVHHEAGSWKDREALRHEADKARVREQKARDEAARWRARYEQSEAKLARVRRVLGPFLRLRRLLRRP